MTCRRALLEKKVEEMPRHACLLSISLHAGLRGQVSGWLTWIVGTKINMNHACNAADAANNKCVAVDESHLCSEFKSKQFNTRIISGANASAVQPSSVL